MLSPEDKQQRLGYVFPIIGGLVGLGIVILRENIGAVLFKDEPYHANLVLFAAGIMLIVFGVIITILFFFHNREYSSWRNEKKAYAEQISILETEPKRLHQVISEKDEKIEKLEKALKDAEQYYGQHLAEEYTTEQENERRGRSNRP